MSLTSTSIGSLESSKFSSSVLKVKKLSQDATLPLRSTSGAAGYDLFSAEDYEIKEGEKECISTGISIQLPRNPNPGMDYVAIVKSRSGLSVKSNLEVGAGVIDSDYTGEVRVVLRNLGRKTYSVKKGDKIAQLLIHECFQGAVEEVSSLGETVRGDKGFGSTG